MDISLGTLVLLVISLGIALAFEAVNGFHDTANAVATVIYTKSLKPGYAVAWSGLMNFLGVLLGGIAVAFSIVHLLPVDMLVHINTGAGIAMVIALLLGAIVWNAGTWYFGIPASSSHALIGSIIGVGLANSFLQGHFGSGVNWKKVTEVGLSLFISPIIGFMLAWLVLNLFKTFVKNPLLHQPPDGDKPPPWWVRGILLLTCTGVSFAHGSNDGQKGIGLIMLILIGLVPSVYAMNMSQTKEEFKKVAQAPVQIESILNNPELKEILVKSNNNTEVMLAAIPNGDQSAPSIDDLPSKFKLPNSDDEASRVRELLASLNEKFEGKESPSDLSDKDRWNIRQKILLLEQSLGKIQKSLSKELKGDKEKILTGLSKARSQLRNAVEYAPIWVLVAVALALGGGTMVGWERIVVTVGEKIGKTHLTYSQGASAELVAMSTIGMADILGLPVSTTHVLSSGVAGTMVANRSGLEMSTVKSIAMAWILTLPVTMALSAGLFLLFRLFV